MSGMTRQKERIVAGGGGTVSHVHSRSLANVSVFLSVLWLLPSAGAIYILAASPADWLRADGLWRGVQAVRFEQWAALSVAALHPFFIWNAVRYARKGADEPVAIHTPNPACDMRKLH